MFLGRISNCFTFLPPCLMSRFGYTAVSNLGFLLGAGENDWRVSCRTRTGWGSTFTLNVCSEFFTPAGMKTEELHGRGRFLKPARSVKHWARRITGGCPNLPATEI